VISDFSPTPSPVSHPKYAPGGLFPNAPTPTTTTTTSAPTKKPTETGPDCASGMCGEKCAMAAGGAGITPDGLISDWDTTETSGDFLRNMREAGNFDGTKELASKAYARYDCNTESLCIMVKAEPGKTIDSTGAWLKIFDKSTSEQPLVPGTSLTYLKSETGATGWEACFKVAVATYSSIEIHASYGGGKTSSTGKNGDEISLQLGCCGSTPVASEESAPSQACTGDENYSLYYSDFTSSADTQVWTNGDLQMSSSFGTSYLGVVAGATQVSKTFAVPANTQVVYAEMMLYETEASTKLEIGVGGTDYPVGILRSSSMEMIDKKLTTNIAYTLDGKGLMGWAPASNTEDFVRVQLSGDEISGSFSLAFPANYGIASVNITAFCAEQRAGYL
jgi:hypothetical protein